MAARALVLALAVATSSGCAATMYREHTTPFPPSTPRTVPWSLNRELLTPVNKRIVFVVEARRRSRARARRAQSAGARWRSATASGRRRGSPARCRRRSTPSTTYVHIRYIGNQLNTGACRIGGASPATRSTSSRSTRRCHRKWKWFLPERHLEAQTLIHEYGHHLGLPPLDHGYYRDYPDFSDGAHCVNPDCALSKPRARALLYGFWHVALARHYLEDYCAQCRASIAAAKAYWRKQLKSARDSAARGEAVRRARSRCACRRSTSRRARRSGGRARSPRGPRARRR